jgi:PhzF family phenazine biosynthesis protein
MKNIHVYLMNSLVDGVRGGNPAGVVLDANNLSLSEMQQVATQVGVSETAFLSESKDATYKLDFFTPARQIPHCGHATIGAFCLLTQLGTLQDGLYSKETIDGIREIEIKDGAAAMQQKPPRFLLPAEKAIYLQQIADSLQMPVPSFWTTFPPIAVHTGNRFLIIPMTSQAALKDIQPKFEEIHRISEVLDCVGFYPFTLETVLPERVASTRMFAPRYGIPEESATGTAAGPLAGYLIEEMHIPNLSFDIEQGLAMPEPSPSLLHIEVDRDDSQIRKIMVGGRAVVSKELDVEVWQ